MDPIDRRLMLGAAGLAGVAAFAKLGAVAHAGPLDPPPGPIAPTGRTLDELHARIARTDAGIAEPRIPIQSLPGSDTAVHVITEPGSYYLTENLQGESGKSGIEIRARDVTIDLAGFHVRGVPGAFSGIVFDGIPFKGTATNIRIANGVVTGWSSGVFVAYSISQLDAPVNEIRDLVVTECEVGITLGGGCVTRCQVRTSAVGLQLGAVMAEDCVVTQCSEISVSASSSVVRRSRFRRNGGEARALDGSFENCEFHFSAVRLLPGHLVDCDLRNASVTAELAPGSVIMRNRLTSAGVSVLSPGNVIVQNVSQSGPTPFSIAPNNSHGPIVNVAGVGDISSVPNANHPWANFVY